MKLFIKQFLTLTIVALLSISYSACEKATDESCEQQDMNEVLDCGSEKNVEVCCTIGASCVYKYNGQEYPDTNAGLNLLADALGCNYKGSANYEAERQLIIEQLIALKDRAWNGN